MHCRVPSDQDGMHAKDKLEPRASPSCSAAFLASRSLMSSTKGQAEIRGFRSERCESEGWWLKASSCSVPLLIHSAPIQPGKPSKPSKPCKGEWKVCSQHLRQETERVTMEVRASERQRRRVLAQLEWSIGHRGQEPSQRGEQDDQSKLWLQRLAERYSSATIVRTCAVLEHKPERQRSIPLSMLVVDKSAKKRNDSPAPAPVPGHDGQAGRFHSCSCPCS